MVSRAKGGWNTKRCSLTRLVRAIHSARGKQIMDAKAAWIFISYRHEQVGHWIARRIADGLKSQLGNDSVFCDTSSIEPAFAWEETIQTALSQSAVCLVLIHPGWQAGQLHNPGDWVRREISIALQRNLTIVPVLVDGAKMPSPSDLPDDVKAIAAVQACFVEGRSEASLVATIGALAQAIMKVAVAKIIFQRDKPPKWAEWGTYDWILSANGKPIVRLVGLESAAACTTLSGTHFLSISWTEIQPSLEHHAGFCSSGETGRELLVLRPGVHVLSLRSWPGKRSSWQRISDGFLNRDSSPRTIVEVSFVSHDSVT
jgi:hypothetical protein